MRNTTFLRCSFMANFVNEDERNLEPLTKPPLRQNAVCG
jgi:hypothetical protein